MLDDREGYAKAFDVKGNEIYNEPIRRYGGHSGVTFSHHGNGSVKKAEYSSHPDGGIQWYRKYTYFDENGIKTNEETDDWDNRVTIPKFYFEDTVRIQSPVVPVVPKKENPSVQPKKPVQETIVCATIHNNRVEFINHSKEKLLLGISQAGKDTIIVLKSGAKFANTSYVSAEIVSPLEQNIRFQFNCRKKNCTIYHTINTTTISKNETLHAVNFYGKRKRLKKNP